MSQPLLAADPSSAIPKFFPGPELTPVEGTIEITVTRDGTSWSYSLSGAGEGWEASGRTITLSPTLQQTQPVLYQLDFSFNENFELAVDGLQISLSPGTAVSAAAVSSSPLKLIHDVTSGAQQLNLGLFVLDLSEQSPAPHEFSDPTIVFDPPQT
jgi:hypothetical protein